LCHGSWFYWTTRLFVYLNQQNDSGNSIDVQLGQNDFNDYSWSYRDRICTLEFDICICFIFESYTVHICTYPYIQTLNMININGSILNILTSNSTSTQRMWNFIPAQRSFLLPHCKQYPTLLLNPRIDDLARLLKYDQLCIFFWYATF